MNTRDGEMIAGKTVWRGRQRGVGGGGWWWWSEERRLSTLCPRHAYIYAQIYMRSASYSRDALLLAPSMYTRAREPMCTYVWSHSRPHVRAPAFNAARPYNSNVETPLTGTRIPDITFTHVIPHQFLETKAANVWWREWDRWVSRRSSRFNFAGTGE